MTFWLVTLQVIVSPVQTYNLGVAIGCKNWWIGATRDPFAPQAKNSAGVLCFQNYARQHKHCIFSHLISQLRPLISAT